MIKDGDVGGISYEVILKALCDSKMVELCTPILYGLTKMVSMNKKLVDVGDFTFQVIKGLDQLNVKKANIINVYDKEVQVQDQNPVLRSGYF